MIFINHWFSWLVLIGFIGLLLYTMKVVKKEGELVEDDAFQVFGIGSFQIKVPNWWTDSLKTSSTQTIRFERTDTSYEWFSELTWMLKDNLTEKDLETYLRETLLKEELEFDMGEIYPTSNDNYPKAENIENGTYTFFRIEGTATQAKTKRCYVDYFVLEKNETGEILLGKNWSSILNGVVEGPYFEKVLLDLIGHAPYTTT